MSTVNSNGSASRGVTNSGPELFPDPLYMHLLNQQMHNATSMPARSLRSSYDRMDERRDIDHECGYRKTEDLTIDLYKEFFDRNEIAHRVVSLLPSECWQHSPMIVDSNEADADSEFEEAISLLSTRLLGPSFYKGTEGNLIWEFLKRADVLSGIGHFGIILIGIDDGKPLSEPVDGIEEAFQANAEGRDVPNARGEHNLLYLRAMDESVVTVQLETDNKNHRVGQPKFYQCQLSANVSGNNNTSALHKTEKVHWTRVVHLADVLESNEFFAVPRQRPVINRIADLRKIYGGSPEMFWLGGFPPKYYETHPQLGGDVDIDYQKMKEQEEAMMMGLQRWGVLSGMTAKQLSPVVSDPTNHIKSQLEAICIQIGCPMRVFMGSERGELSSSQDAKAWNNRLMSRQNLYLTPKVIAPFFDRLILMGVLPAPADGYQVEWQDLNTLTESEKATVAGSMTEALVKYVQGGLENLIEPKNYLVRVWGFDADDVDEILADTLEHMEDINPPDAEAVAPGSPAKQPKPEFEGSIVEEIGVPKRDDKQPKPGDKKEPIPPNQQGDD